LHSQREPSRQAVAQQWVQAMQSWWRERGELAPALYHPRGKIRQNHRRMFGTFLPVLFLQLQKFSRFGTEFDFLLSLVEIIGDTTAEAETTRPLTPCSSFFDCNDHKDYNETNYQLAP